MDMDMEHPQFLGHRGNPWISTAISNCKLLQTDPLPPADRPVHRVRWSLMVWPLLRDLQSGSSPVCSYKFNAMMLQTGHQPCLISCEMDALASVH